MLKNSLIFDEICLLKRKICICFAINYSMFHGMGINLGKPCTIIILQCSGMHLFVIENLKVLIIDYVYIF